MLRALDEFRVGGTPTTLPFHRLAMTDPAFVAGELSTVGVKQGMDLSSLAPATLDGAGPPTAKAPPRRLVIELEGKRFDVDLFPQEPVKVPKQIRARSPGALERARAETGGPGKEVVKTPMQGTIVKVLVAEGDTVKAGQTLVVLEAMKMENHVTAHQAGTVAGLPGRRGPDRPHRGHHRHHRSHMRPSRQPARPLGRRRTKGWPSSRPDFGEWARANPAGRDALLALTERASPPAGRRGRRPVLPARARGPAGGLQDAAAARDAYGPSAATCLALGLGVPLAAELAGLLDQHLEALDLAMAGKEAEGLRQAAGRLVGVRDLLRRTVAMGGGRCRTSPPAFDSPGFSGTTGPPMKTARSLFALPAGRVAKWVVLAAWVAVAALVAPFAGQLQSVQPNEASSFLPSSAESTRALELQRQLPGGDRLPVVVVYRRESGITPADRQLAAGHQRELTQGSGGGPPPLPSEDGKALLLVISLPAADADAVIDQIEGIREAVGRGEDDLQIRVTGPAGYDRRPGRRLRGHRHHPAVRDRRGGRAPAADHLPQPVPLAGPAAGRGLRQPDGDGDRLRAGQGRRR